jgi:hypothetical protein
MAMRAKYIWIWLGLLAVALMAAPVLTASLASAADQPPGTQDQPTHIEKATESSAEKAGTMPSVSTPSKSEQRESGRISEVPLQVPEGEGGTQSLNLNVPGPSSADMEMTREDDRQSAMAY